MFSALEDQPKGLVRSPFVWITSYSTESEHSASELESSLGNVLVVPESAVLRVHVLVV